MNKKEIKHPSAEGLQHWMHHSRYYVIDAVLEYLHSQNLLNKKGDRLAKEYWERYIKTKGNK